MSNIITVDVERQASKLLHALLLLCIAISLNVTEATQCKRGNVQVCGNDGRTYKNICQLNVAKLHDPDLDVFYNGPCIRVQKLKLATTTETDDSEETIKALKTQFRCNLLFLPVCGSDGQTYGNKCSLLAHAYDNPNLKVKHDGRCEDSNKKALHKQVDSVEEDTRDLKRTKTRVDIEKHGSERKSIYVNIRL